MKSLADISQINFLMQHAPDSIVIVNLSGKIENANEEMLALFGYDISELLGKDISILVPMKFRQKHSKYIKEFGKNTQKRPMGSRNNLSGCDKNGRVFSVDIKLVPLNISGDFKYIAFIRDTSQYHDALIDLEKKNKDLKKANESLNEILGMAAHDLRNPLTAISGFIEMIEDDRSLEKSHKEILEYIKSSSQFMNSLVEEILDLSKLKSAHVSLNKREHSLNNIVNISVEMNKIHANKKNIKIKIEEQAEISVLCDFNKIEQVINNILSNAIKYGSSNSSIIVKIYKDITGDANFECSNEGEGIKDKDMDLVFKPFKTTSTMTTGGEGRTGLGLAICKKIIDSHKGKIWFHSEHKKGATFGFRIPIKL